MEKPTIAKVRKDLESLKLPEEIIMYVYHKLNGRLEEAESYLASYQEEKNKRMEELRITPEKEKEEDIQYL